VNLTVTWFFLLGARKLIQMFVCKDKDFHYYNVNTRYQRIKFGRLDDQTLGLFASLL